MNERERLSALLSGFMPTQLAYVMARLRIADLLDGDSLTVAELSSLTATKAHLLRRLLRGMAGVGLVELDGGERVSLTEMGALLASDAKGSLRDFALHRGGESFAAWGELEHTVRTGEPAFEAAHGDPFFTYLRNNPEAGAVFDGTMARLSRRVMVEAIAYYDFSTASRILDVGGGRGHFVAAVLEAYPELDGAVFDVPEVAEATGKRCAAIGGNFFESLPAGYDLHVLKWILHDWNDEDCRKILSVSRAALPDDGRLLVVEQPLPEAIPDSGTLHPVVAMDLIMLVNFGDARERYLHEYEQLLADSGFALHEVVPLPSGFNILDCRPR
jgi:orsellinic acid C2-O-methyltransferase